MTLQQRIEAFGKVGDFIHRHYNGQRLTSEVTLHQGLDEVVKLSEVYNNWFIPKFVNDAIQNLLPFTDRAELKIFTERVIESKPKKVAIICAGNIPLVCFHDVLCVLLCGHNALIKLSEDDKILMPYFLRLLTHYEPAFEQQIFFAESRLAAFDAVIATGSNNTAGYFEHYFGKYPHIIRKSRSSVAIIDGNESEEELKQLGTDIFQYFGLGCRNVTKLMVPVNYKFDPLFEAIVDFGYVVNNKKYGNNYDYHRAIYLLEQIPFLDNNFLMIRENTALHSPVGTLHYEYYDSQEKVNSYLKDQASNIQCIIGHDHIPYGYSQRPVISDFADKTDTIDFLVNL